MSFIHEVIRGLTWVVAIAAALSGAQAATAQTSSGLTFIEAFELLGSPRNVIISPDGLHVYALRTQFLWVLERDSVTGKLTLVESLLGPPSLSRADGMAISADGAHLYFARERDAAVSVFARNALTGSPTFVEVVQNGVNGVAGLDGATAIDVSGDGKNVYVASDTDDALVVFSRDAITGELTFVEAEFEGVGGVTGLHRAKTVRVSVDGENVYAGGRSGEGIATFARNVGTGELTFLESFGLPSAKVESIAPSGDDKHVYVAGGSEDTVRSFLRNAVDGTLTFFEAQQNGVDGVVGLDVAEAVVVSPDGSYVYASGISDDAVVVFDRDASNSRLRFIDRLVDGKDGVTGIASVKEMVVSPDGRHLYANGEGSVVVLRQDECGSGLLTGDEQCDDGNDVGGDGCSSECELELCGPSPAVGCKAPALEKRSALKIDNEADDGKDRLKWRLRIDSGTDVTDFGDPLAAASYLLCLYDESIEPQPRLALATPAGGTCFGKPCWKATALGFKYKDRDKSRTPDGVEKLTLKSSGGAAKINLKGRGPKLGADVLPLTTKVTAQLHNTDTGVCWQAEFSTPDQNDAGGFRAKSD